MASLNFSISMIKFLIYCSYLLLLLYSYFAEKSEAIGNHFHDIEVTSLLAASSCNRQSSTGFKPMKYSTTLELVHRLGPCSPHHEQTKNKPSFADILSYDQSRVDFIQALPKQNMLRKQASCFFCRRPRKHSSLPAQSGLPLDSYNYVVTVGLGTPQQNVTLIFDTGSYTTWTQCKPCIKCYEQQGPMYNPYSSRTYSSVLCDDSSKCSKRASQNLSCYTNPCVYNIHYKDGSYTEGVVSKERLTITSTTPDVFKDFLFGCGQKNEGVFGETAGLLGLGRWSNKMSFLSQTSKKYGRYFSYCLPSSVSSTGYLAFGRKISSRSAKNVKFTPLIPDPMFYRIQIVAISVGKTRLPINTTTTVDSGTAITRLPLVAYVKMRNAFKQMMGNSYSAAPAFNMLDTCYYIDNHNNIKVPSVSFTFSGDVEVELDPSGIVYTVNSTMSCFAFARNTDPNGYSSFGNTQQRTLEVVYDLAGEKVGFGRGGCK